MLSVNGMASTEVTEAEAVADVKAVISEVDAVTTEVDAVISKPTEPASLLDRLKSQTRSQPAQTLETNYCDSGFVINFVCVSLTLCINY